jgi:hypothetical protein
VLLTSDADDHLIQMPDFLRARLLATEAPGIVGPELLPHRRIVSYKTTMPRSSSISSTSRRLRGNRKYSQTAWAMIWGGNRWRL